MQIYVKYGGNSCSAVCYLIPSQHIIRKPCFLTSKWGTGRMNLTRMIIMEEEIIILSNIFQFRCAQHLLQHIIATILVVEIENVVFFVNKIQHVQTKLGRYYKLTKGVE